MAAARTKLREVDAVLLGVGLVGSIVGRELTKAGLKVVGLERGEPRFTVPDFQGPQIHDELRYSVRKATDAGQHQGDGDLPQQGGADTRLADPALGRLPARHRPGRRGGALERPDLSLPGHRLPHARRARSSATARTFSPPS